MNTHESPAYQAALAWLFSRTRAGAVRSSQRAAQLLELMDLSAPPLTVSVVGTNGKGSVSTMTAAGLTASGHVTGRFVSPHVESFRERVAVDGVPVAEEQVTAFVATAQALTREAHWEEALSPAFFEWTLALALREFARRGATAAVLEAGVGGASDATRAVQNVSLVVLTNVDLDHLEALGPTLEQIATDKAGAMRPGIPVVSGVVQPELRALVARHAEQLGAPLHQYRHETPEAEPLFTLPAHLESALATSATRLANARLAAAALRLLGTSEAAVEAGLRAPALPARGERFLLGGVPTVEEPTVEVLLDGAHDPAAARRLVAEIGQRHYALLFGALGRKQGSAVLEVLSTGASQVVITEAQAGEGQVVTMPAGARFVADPAAALDEALAAARSLNAEQTAGSPPLLVVAGSLYLAGRVRPLLEACGVRQPAAWETPAAGTGAEHLENRGAPSAGGPGGD
ncbi:MAG: Mur ligase family protein [Trueperaceae bacterium]